VLRSGCAAWRLPLELAEMSCGCLEKAPSFMTAEYIVEV